MKYCRLEEATKLESIAGSINQLSYECFLIWWKVKVKPPKVKKRSEKFENWALHSKVEKSWHELYHSARNKWNTINNQPFVFSGSRSWSCAFCHMKCKGIPLEEVLTNLNNILRSRNHSFPKKFTSSQDYGFFPSSQSMDVSWTVKNWLKDDAEPGGKTLRVTRSEKSPASPILKRSVLDIADDTTETSMLKPPSATSLKPFERLVMEVATRRKRERATEDQTMWRRLSSGREFGWTQS